MRRYIPLIALAIQFLSTPLAYANEQPQAVSVEPHCGSVPYNNTYPTPNIYKVAFSATYSDPDGWQDLKQVYLLINKDTTSIKRCPVYARYDVDTNKLYVRDWYNLSWVGGDRPGPAPDGGAQWYDTNSCTFYRLMTTVSRSGNDLTVNWYVRFKGGFGMENVYLNAIDSAGNSTGLVQKGIVVIGTNYAPQVGAISPSSGVNAPDRPITFTATYTDANSYKDIQDARLLVNTTASSANGLCVYYDSFANKLYLANDTGDAWLGGYAPGSSNIIENSYAKLDCGRTTVTGNSSVLTIGWNVAFKSAFMPQEIKNTYLYAKDGSGASAGWTQAGTWTLSSEPDSCNLNMDMPWHQTAAPYNSTGAATAQMILNFIRTPAGAAALTQDEIYQYAKSYQNYGADLTPDEMDRVLGHFDPYDALVSNWSDSYDSLLDGNPYQGYNFSVDTYDPSVEADAINKYMRDICHWMAYTVTKEDWWSAGDLVAQPNTPAAVPIYGTYDHWVAIKGFSTSANPCPEPHTNPWNCPDFTVNGLWITDPLSTGIGRDTYKTSGECASTYFLPLSTTDDYNGKFLQVAEPPLQPSQASAYIPEPKSDAANLEFIGVKQAPGDPGSVLQPASSLLLMAAAPAGNTTRTKKKDWRDMLPAELLSDTDCLEAFSGTVKGRPVFVKRPDAEDSDYYLMPFDKPDKKRGLLTSAVIVLNAGTGCFKEASWTKEPERFLKVAKKDAINLVLSFVYKDFAYNLQRLPKAPFRQYQEQRRILYQNYERAVKAVRYADAELLWSSGKNYAASPYQPYWRIRADGHTWDVTQGSKVILSTDIY
jgi:hypothetical protein